MIHTRLCDLLGIDHPVALGGMPPVYNTPALAAAVSGAGGIGIIGCTYLDPDDIEKTAGEVRSLTDKPFGLNALVFLDDRVGYEAALRAEPGLISLAWPRKDQDLEPWVRAAHDAGCAVSFMAADVEDAVRGAEAGADVIVAQGTEGGGHVGWMALSVLLPMIIDAVDEIPVIAAGGVADGRGLAAALAYGADGVLLGTRFLATEESGLAPGYKQAIVASDGHDTVAERDPAHRHRIRLAWRDVEGAAQSVHRALGRPRVGSSRKAARGRSERPGRACRRESGRGASFLRPGCGADR